LNLPLRTEEGFVRLLRVPIIKDVREDHPEARSDVLDEAHARDPRRVQQRLDGGERAHPDGAVCARRFF
jgi:hypothetical protein